MKNKKALLLFFSFILIYGCTTSTDTNSNNSTTVVPITPTNLTGVFITPTKIFLSWKDNSDNETGFKIERKSGNDNYTIVGTVSADILNYGDFSITPNTIYTYRVFSFNAEGDSSAYSNELTLTPTSLIVLPTLTTTIPNTITDISASCGGNISSDGRATVTARGVVWGTVSNPTIALPTKTIDGTGIGNFSSLVSGLIPNTKYYMRAYATNSVGTSYGNENDFTTSYTPGTTVTDIDGNMYLTVTFCNKTWTKTNLNVSHYRNGDVIPQVTDPTQLKNLTTGAWCYFNNDSANGAVYGKLYNWYAVNDPRGLAPIGYHIPSHNEWMNITSCLGIMSGGGPVLKEIGTSHWHSTSGSDYTTNSTGFTALPGGMWPEDLGYYSITYQGFWWSSSIHQNISYGSWMFNLSYDGDLSNNNPSSKFNCLSVRCIKD